MKEEERQEKIRLGHRGKGQKKELYKSFCKTCLWEYQRDTPKCLRCKKDTMTNEERYAELLVRVDQYKKRKNKRVERKKKWENWKKTKQIFWKKMATDYSKWDNFTDSESEPEEEKDPIVPENDPNFQALKWDLDKRNFARREKKKEAIKLKERANKYFKIQDYK